LLYAMPRLLRPILYRGSILTASSSFWMARSKLPELRALTASLFSSVSLAGSAAAMARSKEPMVRVRARARKEIEGFFIWDLCEEIYP